jgi:PTS system mannose-specific IID component/fructoselysine and glucoselysine-specific PTS system IID component
MCKIKQEGFLMTNEKKQSIWYLEPEDKKMINSITWRTMNGSSTYNYERWQALAFLFAMIPAIKRYYANDREKRIEAYKRHWALWNTTPQMAGLATGIAASMERQAAQDPAYDTASINTLKASLMGPLAGIGDSLFWGSFKVIATGVGAAFALQGSILGPLLYFLVYNIPASCARHLLPIVGFNLGTASLEKANKSGLLPFLTKCCNIVGLMTIGAMTTTMVRVNIPYVFEMNGAEMALQKIIDGIIPKVLPVCLTLLCFNIMRKKDVPPLIMIIALVAASIVLHAIGIL